jgi:acid phosphatase
MGRRKVIRGHFNRGFAADRGVIQLYDACSGFIRRESMCHVLEGLESRVLCSQTALPRPDHIVVVIEENKSYSELVNNTKSPYLHSLASIGAIFSHAHAIVSGSIPNYLALFSGSTHGLVDNDTPGTYSSANLWSALHKVHKSVVEYSEDLPSVGFTGDSSGNYVKRHNPIVDFSNVPVVDNQPFSHFPTNYAKLSTVSFVVPNLVHDMEDGSVHLGDVWLKANLGGYVKWAMTHNSMLIVTWDEDGGDTDTEHIPMLMVGPMVKPGVYAQSVNHYSVMQMIEDFYDAKRVGESADAAEILGIWQ